MNQSNIWHELSCWKYLFLHQRFPEQADVDFMWDLYDFQLAELFVVKLPNKFNLFFWIIRNPFIISVSII